MGIEEELLARVVEKEESIGRLEESLAQSDNELNRLREQVYLLESLLHETRGSVSYKVVRRLVRATSRVAPPGSRRRRLLHLSFRVLRAVPKLRDRRWVAHLVKSRMNGSRDKLGQLFNSSRNVMQRLIEPRRLRGLSLSTPLHFPVFDQMDVSIIIPVFNHWQDTLACLESIAQLTAGSSYEVIVVDDASSDETPQVLTQIAGLLTLRNEQNLGFVGSCNRGGRTAQWSFPRLPEQ